MNKIDIPLSKIKLIMGIGGSLLFVILGFVLITIIADDQTLFKPVLLKIAGALSILFFGATGIFGIRKMLDKRIGFMIDEDGITDYSSGVSIGLIEWKDIKHFSTIKINSQKIILIHSNNPEKYIEKANRFRAIIMRINHKMYGTPLSITSNTLQYNFDELEKLLLSQFEIHNQHHI